MFWRLWYRIRALSRNNCSCGYPIEPGWNWCGRNPCKVMKEVEKTNI